MSPEIYFGTHAYFCLKCAMVYHATIEEESPGRFVSVRTEPTFLSTWGSRRWMRLRAVLAVLVLSLLAGAACARGQEGAPPAAPRPEVKEKFWGLDGLDSVVPFTEVWRVIEAGARVEGENSDGGTEPTEVQRTRLGEFQRSKELPRVLRVTSAERLSDAPDVELAALCNAVHRVLCAHLIVADPEPPDQRSSAVPVDDSFVVFATAADPDRYEFQAIRHADGSLDGWLIYDCWGTLVWSSTSSERRSGLKKWLLPALISSCSNRNQAADEVGAEPSGGAASGANSARSSGSSMLSRLNARVFSVKDPSRAVPFHSTWAVNPRRTGEKPRLLLFWATWCAPCVRELPELIALRERYGEDVLFIKISRDSSYSAQKVAQSVAAIKGLLSPERWPWQYLAADDGLDQQLFPAETANGKAMPLPFFVLFDAKGAVVYTGKGALAVDGNRERLIEALDRVRARRP